MSSQENQSQEGAADNDLAPGDLPNNHSQVDAAQDNLQIFQSGRTSLYILRPEILLDVVDYLAPVDLDALSAVSRACYSITARNRFRHMKLKINSLSSLQKIRQGLQKDLDGSRNILKKLGNPESQSDDPYTYLERIEFSGGVNGGVHTCETTQTKLSGFYDPVPRFPRQPRSSFDRRSALPQILQTEFDTAWGPVVSFLIWLPRLTDVVYACTEQVPQALLETLHTSLPRCRLHVHSFSLRSLFRDPNQGPNPSRQGINDAEFMLAKSANLTSVAAVKSDLLNDFTGKINYNEEALRSMVAGLAPNLKRVYIRESSDAFQRQPKPTWQGFYPDQPHLNNQNANSRGRLEMLTVDSATTFRGQMTSNRLTVWARCSNFSVLRSLGLFIATRPEAIQGLAGLASAGKLKSLRSFAVNANIWDYNEKVTGEVDKNVGKLLWLLEPLTDLVLLGHFADAAFDSVVGKHSSSLRHLVMRPGGVFPLFPWWGQTRVPYFIPHDRISECPQRFANLKTVELFIRRTQGDKREVAFYRALGTLPQLERVTLFLDCSPIGRGPGAETSQPYEMGIDEMTRYEMGIDETTRKILINSAVDMELARSIYDLIFPRYRLASSAIQAHLSLEPMTSNFGFLVHFQPPRSELLYGQLLRLVDEFNCGWKVWRSKDGSIHMHVNEKRKRPRESPFSWDQVPIEISQVWDQLWPRSTTGNEHSDWKSKPLEL